MRRVELDKGKYWNISIAEKDAYTCLKESINSLKK